MSPSSRPGPGPLPAAGGASAGLLLAIGVRDRIRSHPYAVVAAALGVGYLLGGGLFTATTARVVRLGLKVAALPLVRDQLVLLAERSVDGLLARGRRRDDDLEARPRADQRERGARMSYERSDEVAPGWSSRRNHTRRGAPT